MDLYCYRDKLRYDTDEQEQDDEEQDRGYDSSRGRSEPPGFGVTLYFAEGDPEPEEQRQISDSFDVSRVFNLVAAIATIIKGKGQGEAVRGIQKWFNTAAPIVQFFRNCIDSGTGSARCLSLAKTAGIKYRRQNALALYNVLKLEKEFETQAPPPRTPAPVGVQPATYEAVRNYFVEELSVDSFFGQFVYEKSELSEADISDLDDEIAPGDFVFEIGELATGTFKYWGHYHAATRRFKPLHIFLDFDIQTLFVLLRR